MRSFKLFFGLSLLLGTRASFLTEGQPVSYPLDVRRIANLCSVVEIPPPINSGLPPIDGCFCIFDVSNDIASGVLPQEYVTFFGIDEFTTIVDNAITVGSSKCSYPAHSIPSCTRGTPCDFQCTDGFTASPPNNPTTCVCEAPSVVCNGRCVNAGGCPSSVPLAKKKRWLGSGVCAEMGPEWAACGIFGGGARAWECINTADDLESCGGCMLPLTPFTPIGQDCSSLPGVADVACITGECVVHRCLPGYVRARDGTHCISKHQGISHSSGDEEEVELIPAKAYGLEHIPLQKY